jgi:hypothetical protein
MEQLESTPLLYPECLLPKWREHLLRPVWVSMAYTSLTRPRSSPSFTQTSLSFGLAQLGLLQQRLSSDPLH